MKAYILTQADVDRLRETLADRYLPLTENGTAADHAQQAREWALANFDRWFRGVSR
jgi:hypothetical protein